MKNWWLPISALLLFVLLACGIIPGFASVPDPEPAPTNTTIMIFVPVPTSTQTPVPPTPIPTQAVAQVTNTPPPAEPTATPTETPLPEPTLPPPVAADYNWLNQVGRTTDNLVYLGNPEAPVTLIDFSDFM